MKLIENLYLVEPRNTTHTIQALSFIQQEMIPFLHGEKNEFI